MNQPARGIAALILLCMLASACKKDAVETGLHDTTAISMVEALVSRESGGLRLTATDMGTITGAWRYHICDILMSTGPYQKSDTSNNGSYVYDWDINFRQLCDTRDEPDSIWFNAGGQGQFTSAEWSGVGGIATEVMITAIDTLNLHSIVNGSFDYSGTLQSAARNRSYTITCAFDLHEVDLDYNYDNRRFTGGTATVILFYKDENGENRNKEGALQFHPDGAATITFGNYSHTF